VTYDLLAPWFLLLLPLALLPAWRSFRARRTSAVDHSSVAAFGSSGVGLVGRLRWLPTACRSLAIALVVVALARPVKADEQTQVRVEGVAIQLVVDRSGSMRALDFTIDGEQVDRLAALKAVVRNFVLGNDDLPGRPNDLIGLVAFARYADSVAPLTLDHDHLVKALDAVTIAGDREAGTAIGDAIALGVERLKDVRTRGDARPDGTERVKSRVMILLTDGENTEGDIEPMDAAELARSFGIKVYTIGVGTEGFAPMPVRDRIFGEYVAQVPVTIDEALLRRIADTTGGVYFRATDTASLASIYGEIDRLERTETESRRYLEYADLAVETVDVGRFRLPPLLLLAVLLLVLDVLLSSTRFRTFA
jgi:Ca-activated chloride channel family protein